MPFRDIEIEEPFGVLRKSRSLMETPDAKVLRLPGKKVAVLVVASTRMKHDGASERLRAERVCREKALRDLVGSASGIQVASVQRSEGTTELTVEAGKAKAKSVAAYLEWTQARIEGIARDLPVVGRWKSAAGKVFYLAIGKVVEGE